MSLIDCNATDPTGTDIVAGTIKFIAHITDPTVLKGTSAEIVLEETLANNIITLLPCIYKVYYTEAITDKEQYLDKITVTEADANLVDLLAAN